VISRVLSSDEDFDDFDDLEDGLAFTETPVEIDVPATEAVTPTASTLAASAAADTDVGAGASAEESTQGEVAETPTTGSSGDISTNGSGRSVLDVNGIGPTYAARLQEVGISTMSDLAGANIDDLAGQIDVIGGRTEIEDWIKQAKEFTSGGATGAE